MRTEQEATRNEDYVGDCALQSSRTLTGIKFQKRLQINTSHVQHSGQAQDAVWTNSFEGCAKMAFIGLTIAVCGSDFDDLSSIRCFGSADIQEGLNLC